MKFYSVKKITILLRVVSSIAATAGCAEDCSEIKLQNQSATSGVYEIKLSIGPCNGVPGRYQNGMCYVKVYCDMDRFGGGWTVFQKRYDGSVNFKQNWEKYESGFGSVAGEFYAGNKFLNMLTSGRYKYKYELLVELDQYREQCRLFARYSDFQIGSASAKYLLTFGSYLGGTAGNGLAANFTPFSTYDKDHHDTWPNNCAETFKGGWWYRACLSSNLNGEYIPRCKGTILPNCTRDGCMRNASKMVWGPARGLFCSFKGTEMKIRPAGYKLHTPQLDYWLCLKDYEFLPCPDDCHWTQWGEWSKCGVPSSGRRTRLRQEEKPRATKNHVECRGPKSQAVKCVPETTVLQTSACAGATHPDCSDIKLNNKTAKSGVYLIKLTDSPCNKSMKNAKTQNGKCCVAVYCDMSSFGGGWTVKKFI